VNPLRTLATARAALDRGEASPAELLSLAEARNQELEAGPEPLNAFLSTRGSGVADEELAAEGPLAGVPVAVKDNICTSRFPTTCGSRILDGFRSPYDATAVRRLKAAGAGVFGKTNLDEFAMGSSTENSGFGAVRHPVDRGRVPGGSSGGSAAAVAAGVVPVALGSSTGGSVRQPASFCGVVGVKPTYGRVSRYGLVAFASSLDVIGILSRTVADAATVLEVIAGHDRFDATCQDRPVPRAGAASELDLSGVTLGVPEEYLGLGLDSGVREVFESALDEVRRAGAKVRSVSLPSTPAAIPCYYVIAPAEASSNLARYDGARYGYRTAAPDRLLDMYERSRGEGFGQEVKRRIMLGTYVLSAGYYEAYYLRAHEVRLAIARDLERVFAEGIDAIFTPTSPTPAFRIGEKLADPYEMYLADVYTVSANLAGIPAVSIPIGNLGRLPVGGQLMCPHWEEERMLGIAHRLEDVIGYVHPLDSAEPATEDVLPLLERIRCATEHQRLPRLPGSAGRAPDAESGSRRPRDPCRARARLPGA
jgi:aspartyl-tRNA(Asn)/glutamyl-tRNA(Gln) amidotransferase subunit A